MEHTITPAMLPIGQIKPNKLNPREEFAPEEIAELAESIKRHGLVQPLAVVRNGKGYELLAGERRLRACKKARLKEVRCEVHDGLLTQEKVELILIENLQRKDLNAIEEARGFQTLNKDWNYTQQEIADKIGRDRSLVAQRLGLLRLPEAWQKRVVTGVTPASYARALVPWVDRPEVLEKVAASEKRFESSTLATFERTVYEAVKHCTRSLRKPGGSWGYYGLECNSDCAFKPTKAQLEQLDVVTLSDHGRGKEQRAFNVQLWKTLQGDALKKRKERETKRGAKANGQANGKAPAVPKVTEAEKARLFRKRVWYYVYDWQQVHVARALQATDTRHGYIETPVLRVLLWFASGWDHAGESYTARSSLMDERRTELELAAGGHDPGPAGRWGAIADLTPKPLADLVRQFCTRLVADLAEDEGNDWNAASGRLPMHVLDDLWGELELDLDKLWRLDAMFCNLHTKDQLVALARELKVPAEGLEKKKKGEIVDALCDADPRHVPKIVRQLKGAKRP